LLQSSCTGDATGPATVRSEPDGADVYLGESFVGSTPETLELPAGTYKISVRLSGYKDWQRDVQVFGGSDLTLRAAGEIARPHLTFFCGVQRSHRLAHPFASGAIPQIPAGGQPRRRIQFPLSS
jgi:hypothetical protein